MVLDTVNTIGGCAPVTRRLYRTRMGAGRALRLGPRVVDRFVQKVTEPRGRLPCDPQRSSTLPELRSGVLVDAEFDRFKRVDLCAYAASHGYQLVRCKTKRGGGTPGVTASSLLMRHPTTDDKIVVRLDRDGHWTYFSVRDDRDNGTIVDFVLQRGTSNLAGVREDLRGWAGDLRAMPPPALVRLSTADLDDRAALCASYSRAQIVANDPYLNSRGIRPETLGSSRFAGTWRVDARGNLLFAHRDGVAAHSICGYERKNAHFAGFSTGGHKTVWASNLRDDDNKLVITEAVIDAFSYHQLHPNPRARYTSTCGSFGERQRGHVAAAIARVPHGSTIVIATDGDLAGDRLADKIGLLAGKAPTVRHRPLVGKDWNEYLQRHERDYIRSLGVRGQDRSR
jgi:hypothetical protein